MGSWRQKGGSLYVATRLGTRAGPFAAAMDAGRYSRGALQAVEFFFRTPCAADRLVRADSDKHNALPRPSHVTAAAA